jgi:hypothetical protein
VTGRYLELVEQWKRQKEVGPEDQTPEGGLPRLPPLSRLSRLSPAPEPAGAYRSITKKNKIYNNIKEEEVYTSDRVCLKLGKSTGEERLLRPPTPGDKRDKSDKAGKAGVASADQLHARSENPAYNQEDAQAEAAEVVHSTQDITQKDRDRNMSEAKASLEAKAVPPPVSPKEAWAGLQSVFAEEPLTGTLFSWSDDIPPAERAKVLAYAEMRPLDAVFDGSGKAGVWVHKNGESKKLSGIVTLDRLQKVLSKEETRRLWLTISLSV